MKCSSIINFKINKTHFLSNFRILLAFLLEEVSVNNDSESYQRVIPASQRKRFSSDTILLDVPIVLLLLMMMIAILNAYKSPTCLFRWPLRKKKNARRPTPLADSHTYYSKSHSPLLVLPLTEVQG